MDKSFIDEEFEKIIINEELIVINRNLGYASGAAQFAGEDSLTFLDKFINPERGPTPDVDTDFVDPFRGIFLDPLENLL